MTGPKRSGWFAAAGQIVGNLESWSTDYDWNGRTYSTREAAINAGWKRFGCDDFNVGQIENDQLVWWGWMDEEHPAEDRVEVAAELGLAGVR